MRLQIHNNALLAGDIIIDRDFSPQARVQRLIHAGYRPVVAWAMVNGEMGSLTRAKEVGRRAGLLMVDIADARERGLLR